MDQFLHYFPLIVALLAQVLPLINSFLGEKQLDPRRIKSSALAISLISCLVLVWISLGDIASQFAMPPACEAIAEGNPDPPQVTSGSTNATFLTEKDYYNYLNMGCSRINQSNPLGNISVKLQYLRLAPVKIKLDPTLPPVTLRMTPVMRVYFKNPDLSHRGYFHFETSQNVYLVTSGKDRNTYHARLTSRSAVLDVPPGYWNSADFQFESIPLFTKELNLYFNTDDMALDMDLRALRAESRDEYPESTCWRLQADGAARQCPLPPGGRLKANWPPHMVVMVFPWALLLLSLLGCWYFFRRLARLPKQQPDQDPPHAEEGTGGAGPPKRGAKKKRA